MVVRTCFGFVKQLKMQVGCSLDYFKVPTVVILSTKNIVEYNEYFCFFFKSINPLILFRGVDVKE